MIRQFKEFYQKHKEPILYVIFGGLTTLVDWWISFALYAINLNVHLSDVIAWCAAVLFAFITNRSFVFQSKRRGLGKIAREMTAFASGRVLTLVMQELIVFAFVDCLDWNKYAIKIAAAVLVVIANFFLSKFWVFRKKA